MSSNQDTLPSRSGAPATRTLPRWCTTCGGEGYLLTVGAPGYFDEHEGVWMPSETIEPCPDCWNDPPDPQDAADAIAAAVAPPRSDMELSVPPSRRFEVITSNQREHTETDTLEPIPDWPARRSRELETHSPAAIVDWVSLHATLSERFPESQIRYRAGATNKDKTKAQALPYVDPRTYEDRLNETVPDAWQVTFEPWGTDRIICRLTIYGVTRSSTGEAGDSPKDIAGTSAEAQAFKRACAKFGLGRYLYAQSPTWVSFDAATGRLGTGTTDRRPQSLDNTPTTSAAVPRSRGYDNRNAPTATDRYRRSRST